jgi:hypothetical protein
MVPKIWSTNPFFPLFVKKKKLTANRLILQLVNYLISGGGLRRLGPLHDGSVLEGALVLVVVVDAVLHVLPAGGASRNARDV